MEVLRRAARRAAQWSRVALYSYVFLGVIGAVLGILLFGAFDQKPHIGVITILDTPLSTQSVSDITAMLQYARERRDIKAVVLKLDSPGGSVISSEEFYFQMFETRKQMPVVVAVDNIAASGGYYAAMGANYIYVKPTSFVGSVGALIFLSDPLPPIEGLFSTGPFKLTGGKKRDFINLLEEIKEAFAAVVISERGDRLRLSKEELVSARLYTGSEAFRLGLVDAIGTEIDAIRKAADLAGVRNYKVVDVNTAVARLRAENSGGDQSSLVRLPRQEYKTAQELLANARFPFMYYLFLERP